MTYFPVPVERLIAWGQYMHWAELQFARFKALPSDRADAVAIGTVAHWLAAEYVVLEGWLAVGLTSTRISQLLAAYPEHKDLLRRCRNGVYHFQDRPLDPRIGRVLKDQDEELRWSVALHFEFHGTLLRLSDNLRLRGPLGPQAALELSGAIGWFPEHPYADQVERLEALCFEFEAAVGADQSAEADDARAFIETSRTAIESLDMYPLTSSLRRFVTPSPSSPTSGVA
jgi:hypothetical protein